MWPWPRDPWESAALLSSSKSSLSPPSEDSVMLATWRQAARRTSDVGATLVVNLQTGCDAMLKDQEGQTLAWTKPATSSPAKLALLSMYLLAILDAKNFLAHTPAMLCCVSKQLTLCAGCSRTVLGGDRHCYAIVDREVRGVRRRSINWAASHITS